jgi:hypothetical protein
MLVTFEPAVNFVGRVRVADSKIARSYAPVGWFGVKLGHETITISYPCLVKDVSLPVVATLAASVLTNFIQLHLARHGYRRTDRQRDLEKEQKAAEQLKERRLDAQAIFWSAAVDEDIKRSNGLVSPSAGPPPELVTALREVRAVFPPEVVRAAAAVLNALIPSGDRPNESHVDRTLSVPDLLTYFDDAATAAREATLDERTRR